MKILSTADWHIGLFKGPEVNGNNLRAEDTKKCIAEVIRVAQEEHPELSLISGDIFHVGKTWGDRQSDEVITAYKAIKQLAKVSGHVVVLKGTQNHDGDGQFKLLSEFFASGTNVSVMSKPGVIHTDWGNIVAVPGFDAGEYRAKYPGLSKQEENEVFSKELSNIVMGLRADCTPDRPAILMAHFTVPGANMESGQTQLLTQFEPVISQECLLAANYDLVALGHIHRPQQLPVVKNAYYSGALNALNFNDEGQERGFWIHKIDTENGLFDLHSDFYKTPYREFLTLVLENEDVEKITAGDVESVAVKYWRYEGAVQGRIVRILYTCTLDNHKAFNHAQIEQILYDDGAFWVSEISPERTIESSNRNTFSEETDPEDNLTRYLYEKCVPNLDAERLISKARPIISKAMIGNTAAAFSGVFVPKKIEVENYRAYENEAFDFEGIDFCTINGPNGAGKSSLFMDAIIDCLFEEPREGKGKKGDAFWVRNAAEVKKGAISFTFSIGDKIYRVVRTRVRSKAGNLTLNLAEQVDGEWQDRSKPRSDDTQDEILNILGMDSMTLKSCALIMQDQYGLFLQAGSEERMSVLTGLLGLGIYGDMESMARDELAHHRQICDNKTENVRLIYSEIEKVGNPTEELDGKIIENEQLSEKLQIKSLLKEQTSMLLSGKKTAIERLKQLENEILTAEYRRDNISRMAADEDHTIAECDEILKEEFDIAQKVIEFHRLEEQEKQLIEVSAAYKAKEKELISSRIELESENSMISQLDHEMRTIQEKLTVYNNQNKTFPEIKKKADEYRSKLKALGDMQELFQKYNEVQTRLTRAEYDMDTCKQVHRQEEIRLDIECKTLEDKTKLLADSQCIDIDNAMCKFLFDAKAAGVRLKQISDRKRLLIEKNQKVVVEKENVIATLLSELNAIGFDSEAKDNLKKECQQLQIYEAKLEEHRKLEEACNTLTTKILMLMENIKQAKVRKEVLEQKVFTVETELRENADGFLKYENVLAKIEALRPWVDKERMIPVSKERRNNALRMKEEYVRQINNFEMELTAKRDQAGLEKVTADGSTKLENQLSILNAEIREITEMIHEVQQSIGALNLKLQDMNRMQDRIDQLNKDVAEKLIEISDYDMLRVAFSKEGIPHQIVRSIIPRFEDIANSILGDMTGGRLGVIFRTERVKRNKDEKPTLDIFIEESGKTSLPYLSKSGGEKVKSSLAVILALAEIKATTAGIQFGFLQIDEPPFLDAEGIQAYCDALEAIRRRYPNIKIMAITHDPTMKIRFPQSVTVIKTEAGSRVVID